MSEFLSITECGFVRFTHVEDLDFVHKKIVKKLEKNLKKICLFLDEESISRIYEGKGMMDDVL